jgi:hypothetical protein
MINRNKKIAIVLLFVGLILTGFFSACKKNFFNVNNNPNHPTDVNVNFLLPSAEASIAQALGNNLAIYGGIWGQYWTQNPASSQYISLEQYSPASSDADFPWGILYSNALIDLQTIVTKATASNQMQYVACAKILEAYTYQLITDNWGDVPFSQALQAQSGILSPKYDVQKSVYTNIIQLVTDGLALLDTTASGNPGVPANDDIFCQGNMTLWKHFGNTLKLRMYLRISGIDPTTAQSGIQSLQTSGALFLQSGEEIELNYSTTGGNTNPLYASYVSLGNIQNLVASSTCINYMLNYNDYRLYTFYTGANGLVQGSGPKLSPGTPVSYPSAAVGSGNDASGIATPAAAPVILMSSYESLFLQAEAVARGWMTGDDNALYQAGITENYSVWISPMSLGNYGQAFGVDSAQSWAAQYYAQDSIQYPVSGTLAQKLRAIITQKWASMCGNQNDEAWIEWRRTTYPNFLTVSVTSIIGGNKMPQRMFYPNNEVTTNQNFPGQPTIYSKVWWDIN